MTPTRHTPHFLFVVCCLVALPFARAAGADADGLTLTELPGPPVWVEEHWDVKPDKFLAFLAVYDKEVYALARQTPGYRGYTVMTIQPTVEGETPISCDKARVGGHCRLGGISPDGRLGGQFTQYPLPIGKPSERLVNWDGIFEYAFSVLIVHHMNSWPDADKFRARLAALYAAGHPGESFEAHLAQTLNPMASVYWTADYRLLASSWQAAPHAGPRPPLDADGLNFDPVEAPDVNPAIASENWYVPPEKFHAFIQTYMNDVMPSLRAVTGYRGVSIATSIPPQDWEKDAAPMTADSLARLGGSDALYAPGPPETMDGVLRSGIAINVGALYKKTFNVIVRHQLKSWETIPKWSKGASGGGYTEIYARTHEGASFDAMLYEKLMPNAENHWDSFYRLIKTSFVPGRN